jgi:hypothetical protein
LHEDWTGEGERCGGGLIEKSIFADEAVGGEVDNYICRGKVEVLVVGSDVYDAAVTAYLDVLHPQDRIHCQ